MKSPRNGPWSTFLLEHVVPPAIEDVLKSGDVSGTSLEGVYQQAVRDVVGTLLEMRVSRKPDRSSSPALPGRIHDLMARHGADLGVLTADDIGRVYEYLRTFRMEFSGGKKVSLVPCKGSRRNQGLFYTPAGVVRYIVRATLDAIAKGDASRLPDWRLVDPAVGTGAFLVEALDQLAGRVLSACSGGDDRMSSLVQEIVEHYGPILAELQLPAKSLTAVAVMAYLVENCLYGVDLDPVAVTIARAAVLETAFEGVPVTCGIDPRIHVGNSLVGEARTSGLFSSPALADHRHAAAYFGDSAVNDKAVASWAERISVFHWPHRCPEIMSPDRDGFDAVIGNPPYEILSVQESGIGERRNEQRYFRSMYQTCTGKVNTYRLMIERALDLLRPGGVLGFIVPATLLADTTASGLRQRILDECRIMDMVILPEKARVFDGVTQALLILLCRNRDRTESFTPTFWTAADSPLEEGGTMITRPLIEHAGMRIPLIKSQEEKSLLEALARHAPFGGSNRVEPVGSVHQGEINLSVHRRFITPTPTAHPLIRGEHVDPFRVNHPSARPGRWDWVDDSFFTEQESEKASKRRPTPSRSGSHGKPQHPWQRERLALARVVNMATDRRLKAALIPTGCLLGDMTNFIANPALDDRYLLGLLNSRLLNWRLKLTSTNNYVSAAEIESLPIPRTTRPYGRQRAQRHLAPVIRELIAGNGGSVVTCLSMVDALIKREGMGNDPLTVADMIAALAGSILSDSDRPDRIPCGIQGAQDVLDALVVKLYRVEPWVKVITG